MALKPDTKSYLSETISSFSPWGSRSATPAPKYGDHHARDNGRDVQGSRTGGDHRVNPRHRIDLKTYPSDCPPLQVQWFFASDVPKRKPNLGGAAREDEKPPAPPKKWIAFSAKDSRSIESTFQKIPDRNASGKDHGDSQGVTESVDPGPGNRAECLDVNADDMPNTNLGNAGDEEGISVKVPVNEDYLFDVDIENRELAPAYWLGPIYEVRRGSWFYAEGATLRPCDENLALQLEEGYLKTKPWRTTVAAVELPKNGDDLNLRGSSRSISRGKPMTDSSSVMKSADDEDPKASGTQSTPLTHRLFGSHMSSVVTYQDSMTAWLTSDDFLSRMSSTVYSRFAGGAHFSGTKVVRGYSEAVKKKGGPLDLKLPITPNSISARSRSRGVSTDRQADVAAKRRSLPALPVTEAEEGVIEDDRDADADAKEEPEPNISRLERQMSSLISTAFTEDPEKQAEEERNLEEKEIRDDYRDTPGDPQDRVIEHLVLVTHGIGQRLGARFETFNFIHDVNQLRKTLKAVYSSAGDLQALNAEIDRLPKNCRLQVLPICWRHQLDFPKKSLKHNRKEYDLADTDAEDDDQYPSLQDITVEGVPALRNIVADLALDILLYQNDVYKEHISKIVAQECNRIFKLFKERNPYFQGKISMIGHSLGSAVMFDILTEQSKDRPTFEKSQKVRHAQQSEVKLNFDVDSLICLGSPIGLFSMLKGKTIAGRKNPNSVTLDGLPEFIDDAFQQGGYTQSTSTVQMDDRYDAVVSSPKCQQLFNIFHPTDPIAYRLEPLISPSMATLKPQNLPYVKKSFLGAPMGQGLTGIPAMVGQSFSGFWSNFSSGLADRFIHRSLGISPEDAAKLGTTLPTQQSQGGLSVGAGTNITSGGVISVTQGASVSSMDDDNKRELAPAATAGDGEGQHPLTLLDSGLETLYSGFHNQRKSRQESDASLRDLGESPAWAEAEERGRKLQKEEAKVRALNSNGRVDYSIQEGAFDISFLASIASHLAYWTDEDVSHFLISQLLSRQRIVKRSPSRNRSRSQGKSQVYQTA